MAESTKNRRDFLRVVGGSTVVGASSMLAGCTSDSDGAAEESPGDTEPEPTQVTNTETPETSDVQTGGTLRFGMEADLNNNIHPHRVTGVGTHIVYAVTNRLVKSTPDYELIPDLAKELPTIENDGLRHVYEIHEGVQFHEPYKRELKAEDVVWNYRKLLEPDYSPRMQGRIGDPLVDDPQEAIRATGEYELEFNLRKAFSPEVLGWVLQQNKANVVPPESVEEHGDQLGTPEVGLFGTGPFVYAEGQPGEFYRVERNPDFFKESEAGPLPYLDAIEFVPILEGTTRTAAVRTGDVDYIENIPPSDVQTLRDDDEIRVKSAVGRRPINMWLNQRRFGPFTNKNVRKAIRHATNQEAIVNVKFNGDATITQGPLPPIDPFYNEDAITEYPFDIERAQSLLEEAGETEVSFESRVRNQATYVDSAEIAKQGLSQANIDMTINTMENAAVWAPVVGSSWDTDPPGPDPEEYQSHIANWKPGPASHMLVLRGYRSGRFLNLAFYENEDVDSWIDQLLVETDDDRKQELYDNIVSQVTDDTPYNHLVWRDWTHAGSQSVRGLPVIGSRLVDYLETVWIDQS